MRPSSFHLSLSNTKTVTSFTHDLARAFNARPSPASEPAPHALFPRAPDMSVGGTARGAPPAQTGRIAPMLSFAVIGRPRAGRRAPDALTLANTSVLPRDEPLRLAWILCVAREPALRASILELLCEGDVEGHIEQRRRQVGEGAFHSVGFIARLSGSPLLTREVQRDSWFSTHRGAGGGRQPAELAVRAEAIVASSRSRQMC